MIVGVSVFILAADPGSGIQEPRGSDWIASLIPVGVVAGIAVTLGGGRRGPSRAMFLGAAAGLVFGFCRCSPRRSPTS